MEDAGARILALINKTYPLKMFTDLQKEAIAAHAEVVTVADGETVYREGAEAAYLYIILSGQVRLTLPVDEDDPEAGEQTLGDLEPADVVGLEALEEESEYLTNAVALETVRLARLNMEFLDPLFEENAIPYTVLMLLLSSLKLFLKLDFSWRNPDEAVLFVARRHWMFAVVRLLAPLFLFVAGLGALLLMIVLNQPGTTLPGFAAGGVTVIGALWAIWNFIDWTNDYSILTNQRAVFQERVVALYDSRQETPLDAILQTSVDTSQVGRIVGYGDVVMKTYTGTLVYSRVPQWEAVRLLVDDRRTRAREASIQADKQTLQNQVRQRLRLLPPAAPAAAKNAKAEEPRLTLGLVLANLLQMRSDKAGVLTYRTHWFVLMKGMFLPLLALTGLVVLSVLRWLGVLTLLSSAAFWPVMMIFYALNGFWLWYRYEDWANDKYIVSDEQIVDVYKKPLGQEEKRVAPLKSIQSVEFERLGITGLIFNFGTVYIRIGDTRFTFDNVFNPSEVQRDLFHRIASQANRERRREADSERQRILEVLEAYHEVVTKPVAVPPPAVAPSTGNGLPKSG